MFAVFRFAYFRNFTTYKDMGFLIICLLCSTDGENLKGTVARVFRALVFSGIKSKVAPQNIFENILVFSKIFTDKVFFHSDLRDSIPGGCTTSGYFYNPRVTISGNF